MRDDFGTQRKSWWVRSGNPGKPSWEKSLNRILLAGLIGLVCLTSFVVHQEASFSLPIPWPDEALFLWQAIAFQESNHLFAPQLNPEKSLFWMLPGYMVSMGTIFKVTGFSLEKARWISWLLSLLAYFGLLALFRDSPWRILCWVIISIFFLSPEFVVMGNVARMESMLLGLVIWSFVLIQRGHFWLGLAGTCLGILIHPNGAYFLLAALAWALLQYGTSWPRIKRWDVVAWSIVLMLGIACVVYLIQNLTAFQELMGFQAPRKYQMALRGLSSIGAIRAASIILLYAATAWVSWSFGKRGLQILVLGAACFFVYVAFPEMWYRAFFTCSILLLLLRLIQCLDTFRKLDALRIRKLGVVFSVFAIVVVSYTAIHFKMISDPVDYPHSMRWFGMRMSDGVNYKTASDLVEVKGSIESMRGPGGGKRVQFFPLADALLFWPEASGRWIPHHYHPIFSDAPPDIIVVHNSRYLPTQWKERIEENLDLVGAEDLVVQRDKTEMWFVAPAEP